MEQVVRPPKDGHSHGGMVRFDTSTFTMPRISRILILTKVNLVSNLKQIISYDRPGLALQQSSSCNVVKGPLLPTAQLYGEAVPKSAPAEGVVSPQCPHLLDCSTAESSQVGWKITCSKATSRYHM